MKYLTAEKQATQFHFKVHMDETKPQSVDNIRDYSWGLTPPIGQTEQQYTDMMKREIPLLVANELKRINTPTPAPTPLAGF